MNSLATTCWSTYGPLEPNGVIATITADCPTRAVEVVEGPAVAQVGEIEVGACDQRRYLFVAAQYRPLVSGNVAEQRTRSATCRPLSHRITLWWLDFDDFSACVREHLAAIGRGDTAG
jgi:hypothetical protein